MNLVKIYTILLLCLAAFSQTAFAQATLSVQGVLKNSDGSAVDNGKYSLGFKLYNSATGGTAIWTETQSDVLVTGGIYSVLLGSEEPLTAAFNETYYIGVSVDGGAELVPRARLTSSPYALSLLGTDNLFPSSGPIGAGTVSPIAGYQLHVKNASGVGKLLVEGSDAGQIDFKKGGTVGSVGFGSSSNDFIVNPGSNNTKLQYNGTTKLTVNTDGVDVAGTLNATTITGGFTPSNLAVTSKLAVGQSSVDANYPLKVNGPTWLNGNTAVTGLLDVSGNTTYGTTNYSFILFGINAVFVGTQNPPISIKATGGVAATGFYAYSDRRIKKDFRLSDRTNDLATLQKLRVTDYRHVDVVQNGTAFKKGFVAQEVEQVFPEAVSQSENFVPDVYAVSTRTQLSGNQMTISLGKNHGFAVGDEVKLMLADGEKKVFVTAVPAENSFAIDWNEAATDKVFVYGKKVSDFHTVDYDRIFTLNVSATQELAREVEELKKENAALRSELGSTKAENTAMKASAEKFDARLRALENKLSN